jgi:putative tricarboxylic transport membrane protein
MLEGLLAGLATLAQPEIILALLIGTAIGMAFGVTPGLDATSGTALLVSATYALSTETALAVLLALYSAATYAGSITAITIGVPGTPASAATVLDGYAMTRKGNLRRALSISIVVSVMGGLLGTAALMFLTIPLSSFALSFGAPEYFALGVLGVAIIASLVEGMVIGGFIVALFGLLITTIGIDPYTGFPRFTFGNVNLIEGVPYIPALVGLFAVSEAISLLAERDTKRNEGQKPGLWCFDLPWASLRRIMPVALVGSLVGSILGALPAIGAAAANWIGYNEAKRVSRDKANFGKGSEEGLAAAESSNNATVSSSLIPLLAFGIPGSATAAVLLGALMLHGVTPGPTIFTSQMDLVYFMFLALGAANLIMLLFGVVGVGAWVRLVRMPTPFIVMTILTLSVVGSYSVRSNVFDVYLAIGLGVFGFALRKAGLSVVPIVLAIVLGSLMEENLRRSLIMSSDGMGIFLDRPIALVVLALSFFTFVVPLARLVVDRLSSRRQVEDKTFPGKAGLHRGN